jgi:hypothetical protein
MPADNSEQIAEWNGALGERWVAMQQEIERITAPFGDAALSAAAPQPGERVTDIGWRDAAQLRSPSRGWSSRVGRGPRQSTCRSRCSR